MNMHLAYETGRRISFLLYYASRVLNNTDSESQVCCMKKKDSFLYALCLGPCYCNCCRTCIEVSKKKFSTSKKKDQNLASSFSQCRARFFLPFQVSHVMQLSSFIVTTQYSVFYAKMKKFFSSLETLVSIRHEKKQRRKSYYFQRCCCALCHPIFWSVPNASLFFRSTQSAIESWQQHRSQSHFWGQWRVYGLWNPSQS